MATKLLPTTMVGSYPRPSWFRYQLEGRDILDAFKVIHHREAFDDAVRTVLKDQENAGLDILADGQMWFDDYSMGIGSFLWYWLERIEGFGKQKLAHPKQAVVPESDKFQTDEAGGVALNARPERGPIRMAQLFRMAQANTERPIKACVGAGPLQLAAMTHFVGGPVKDRYELAHTLADIFNAEIKDLVAAGCRHIQLEDLGAWFPSLSRKDSDYKHVVEVVNKTLAGVDAATSWHFCKGNAWGNKVHGMASAGYPEIVPHYHDVNVKQFVLDFACREMEDASLLAALPKSKSVAVGVIDVRTLEIEQPEQIAERVRKVLKFIEPERVTLTTDCGMKQLPRPVAVAKLASMVRGADTVRKELTGTR